MNCREFKDLTGGYLLEELAEDKREAFEAHYFECDDCFAELKIQERLFSKEIPVVLKGRKPVFVFDWNWKPVLAMASFVVVAFLSWWVFMGTGAQGPFYELSLVEPPVYFESETRGPGIEANGTLSSAMSLYSKKQYTDALKILKSLDKEPVNPQVVFYRGICYLETGETKAAVKQFDIIIRQMNASYYDESIFYKAIALLRLNKVEESLEQLKLVADMYSPYAPRAKALTEKIR